MRIAIGQPPLEGNPTVAQNRQFQWYRHSNRIYPVIHAYAATMLAKTGHEVIFNPREFVDADLYVWEVKTPVMEETWRLINSKKSKHPNRLFFLVGDHVTEDPHESFKNSKVDMILSGGNWDFTLLYALNNGFLKGAMGEKRVNLDQLPLIDRKLTNWREYAYKNGNFYKTPGTYTMFARDCWWGKCTFCSWASLYPNYKIMSAGRAVDEVKEAVRCGCKEVFDDSGTFPKGEWLNEFCEKVIKWKEETGSDVGFGCNLRPGSLGREEYHLLRRTGFNFVLFGMESGNDRTLQALRKGYTVGEVEEAIRMASEAGLKPHATVMFGYPWESSQDADNTIQTVRRLFRGGLYSVQATMVVPYPNTLLWKEASKCGAVIQRDWKDFDMSKRVLQSPIDPRSYIKRCYNQCICKEFIKMRLGEIRSWDDVKRLGRSVLAFLAQKNKG